MVAEEVLWSGVEPAGLPCRLEVGVVVRDDCRVRPLEGVFVKDARVQVHYMRYLCEVMKKECLEKSPLNLNLVGKVGGK